MTVLRTVDATPGQRLLWMMEHYRGADTPLNVNACYRLRGPLDRPALRTALDRLVERHEALRTTYESVRRRLVQHVHTPRPAALVEEEVGPEPEALAEALLRHARHRHDLAVTPLHAALLTVGPEESVLVLNIHHLSTDGWSGGVLSQELGRLYRPGGEPVAEPGKAAWQFADFSEWQRQRYEDGVLAESQKYWRDTLAGAEAPRLPGTSAIRDGVGQLPGLAALTLEPELVAGLTALCRKQRSTIFVAALALFAGVLYGREGQRDVALASMFANRTRPELAGTVGFLCNLLVLRLDLEPQAGFLEVLRSTRDTVLDSLAHQEVPYHLVPQGRGERGEGLENILFQVAVGPEYALRLSGLEVTQVHPPGGMASRFDLEFVLMPTEDRIEGQVWYDRRRFDPAWVDGLTADFRRLAEAVVAEPGRPLAELVAELAQDAVRVRGGGS